MEDQKEITQAPQEGMPDSAEQANAPSVETSEPKVPEVPEPELNAFEVRRLNRIERLRERAKKKRKEGELRLKSADDIASCIPPGQPILVGHHSEKRHRKDLQRIHGFMRKGFDLIEASNRLERRAESAETNGAIFTEDPRADEKLEARIQELEAEQTKMKEVNRRIRSGKSLLDLGISASAEAKLRTPDFLGRIGYPDYALKNNNANIRRLKARLEEVRKQKSQPEPEEIEVNGIRLVENIELNRVQLYFPGKPSEEVRRKLKSDGFRWSPFNGCWQRHRSPYASQLAKQMLQWKP